MAGRLSVDQNKILDTLKETCFKGASEEEMLVLVAVSNRYGLDPLTKQIYAFPSKGGITPVVSVDGWLHILNSQPQFDGIEFLFEDGPDGKPASVTAVVYRKDRTRPTKVTEYFAECYRPTEPWKQFPRRMLRHKAVKEAVSETEVPKTNAFKRFIAGTQWSDKDGNPKVFYHATAREFFEFTPAGQSQAIFLAETPEEAETFGSIAEDRLRREIYRALTKDEKLDFFQRVVDAQEKKGSITEKQGAEFMRQAKRKVPEYGNFGDIEQETYDALLAQSIRDSDRDRRCLDLGLVRALDAIGHD
jgi:hypothetical protein